MLPKITGLSTTVHLPISGKDARVYAYTIREYKNILIAKGQENYKDSEDYLIELLKDKVPDIDVENLTMQDIVVLFITLMSISKGTSNTLWYKCINIIDDIKPEYIAVAFDLKGKLKRKELFEGYKANRRGMPDELAEQMPVIDDIKECGCEYKVNVDIADYKITGSSENNKIFSISDNIKVELIYPTYKILKSLEKYPDNEYPARLCAACIAAVYDNEDAYVDTPFDELYEWVLNLPPTFLDKFNDFIENMPVISLSWTTKCPKCGSSSEKHIEDLIGFFIQSSQTRT